jgi:TolB-like protein
MSVSRTGSISWSWSTSSETLAASLHRETLDEPTLIRYAAQIADALAEAHEHGILHRDVKPQNVIVTPRGQIKVLDFGLAKAIEGSRREDDATVTEISEAVGIVGTPLYMSPEQVRGEPLDARSDAFSLGNLMYEALSGRPPFAGRTSADTVSKILTAEPTSLTQAAPVASAELQRIIRKCLEKDRSRRYQTLRDVATDLENLQRESSGDRQSRLGTAGGEGRPAITFWHRHRRTIVVLGTIVIAAAVLAARAVWRGTADDAMVRTIAILPMKPLAAGVPENVLGLGIADALITRLGGTPALTLRPTSAVRRYAAEETDALKAGSELRVDAVLDGTWQRDQERLRVSVNLLRVSDGVSLWAETFDTAATDPFAMQDRVSERLASRLRLQLDPERRARLRRAGTSNPDAYEAYTRAQFYFSDRAFSASTRKSVDAAVQLYERAISLDPDYAEAHARLGYAYAWTAIFIEDNPELIERAKRETKLAEALEPNLGQIHLTRGFLLWSKYEGWRLADAIPEYRRAEQLDPSLAEIELASAYAHLGLVDLLRKVGQRLIDQDPMNQQMRETHVNEYYLLNLPEEGFAAQKRLLNTGPDERYFLLTRRVHEAAPLVEAGAAANPENAFALGDLAFLRALQGRHAEARELAGRALSRAQRNRGYHHLLYDVARVFALGGAEDDAAKWLQETIDWGFPAYPIFSTDSFFDPIRDSPAFRRVLSELKPKWESYVALLR